MREGGPFADQEDAQDLLEVGVEFVLFQVGLQAEFAQEFYLEGEQGLRLRRMAGEMFQEIREQGKNLRDGRFHFRSLLDERGAVRGLLEILQFLADGGVGFAEADFAELVQFGTTAALEAELGEVKQIKLAGERGFGTARAFSHGGDAPKIRREPMDDEAGVRERTGAQNQADAVLSHGSARADSRRQRRFMAVGVARVVGTDGAEADDELETFGHRHVELGDLLFRHQHHETGSRIRRGGYEHAHQFLRRAMKGRRMDFAREKADRIHSRARKFHHDDGLEGIFVAGRESFVHLLGRDVNLVKERHARKPVIHRFDESLAEIIAREQADDRGQDDRHQKRREAPVPVHRPLARQAAAALVGDFLVNEKEQRVRDFGRGEEEPENDDDRDHPRQHNGQPGKKVGAPPDENVFLHALTLGFPCSFLKSKSAANSRTRRSSFSFMRRRAAARVSS